MTDIDVNAQFVTIKVPDDIDMSKPIPLRISRNEEDPNLWATTDGRRVFNSEEWAVKSIEMDTQEYKDNRTKAIAAGAAVAPEIPMAPNSKAAKTIRISSSQIHAVSRHYSPLVRVVILKQTFDLRPHKSCVR